MNSISTTFNSRPGTTSPLDPLIEQMSSVNVNDLPTSPRIRRFSDADRPAKGDQTRIGSTTNANPPQHPSSPTSLQQHICSSALCAVSKVFSTPELLELILSFLDTKSILVLRQTSRHWNSTIHASPQLRLHLFTFPQWTRPDGQLSLLPLNLPGLSIRRGLELHLGQWIEISFTPEAARRIVPHPKQRVRSRSIFSGLRGGLGPRRRQDADNDAWPAANTTPVINSTLQYEDLLVSQPPAVGVQAYIIPPTRTDTDNDNNEKDDAAASPGRMLLDQIERAANRDRAGPRPCAKLSSETGLSLGFLAQTAQELITPQKTLAGPSSTATVDGEPAKIMFRGIVSFCEPEKVRKRRGNPRSVTMLG